ncbi:MAG: hypothetical protein LBJ13_02420 [Puniceicoccales bacterium]|nr:hypothetical protein [Puniceicoccales bacterium]
MAQGIDVRHISKLKQILNDSDEVYFDEVHTNAMSYLRMGYHMYGETPELKYMEDTLVSRGVVGTPPLDYNDGGCCEVQ